MNTFSSADPARFTRAIDVLHRCGGGAHIPLVEAARDGVIVLACTSDRKGSLPLGKLRKTTRPTLVLIGDDDDMPTGPDGWFCARQITSWARGAIVHGAGAETRHYEAAVAATVLCGRFLLVDTASRYAAEWAALLGHVQCLVIIPRHGNHPLEQPQESVH